MIGEIGEGPFNLQYSKDILTVKYKNPNSAIEKAFSLLSTARPHVLEVGGGNTNQITFMARNNHDIDFLTTDSYALESGHLVPEYAYVAAEWASGKLLAQVVQAKTPNLAVLRASALELEKVLPAGTVDKILLSHPEPEVLNMILNQLLQPGFVRILRPGWSVVVKPHQPISQNQRTGQLLKSFVVKEHPDIFYGVDLSTHVPITSVSKEKALIISQK